MSKLIKHAIIKDNVVINSIEYDSIITGTPPGFEEGVIAIPSDYSIGFVYENEEFIDKRPKFEIIENN
jgi:hypothetical protein